MDIQKIQKAVSISKVEENERADVTKAKPRSRSDTPDSFEMGGLSTSDNQSNGSATTEQEKKAGQITGGILIKQMTAARLSDPRIKSESTKSKEVDSRREQQSETRGQTELTPTEEKLAGEKAPISDKPPEKQQGMSDARTRFEDSRDALMQQFTDIYGERRGDGSMSSGGESSSGGGGVGSSGGMGGHATPEQREQFDEMMGRNQGPQSYASQLEDMEAKVDKLTSERDKKNERLKDELNPFAGLEDDKSTDYDQRNPSGGKYGGKDMVANKGYTTPEERKELENYIKEKQAKEEAAAAAAAKPPAPPEKTFGDKVKDVAGFIKTAALEAFMALSHPIPALPKPPDEDTGKNMIDGAEGIGSLQNRTYEQKVDEKGGNSDPTKHKDPDEETYRKGKYDEFVRQTGIDPLSELPKSPKIEGDKDPTEDAVANNSGSEVSRLAQQSEYDLLGQPNQDRELGSSRNVSTGGNIDYEDQTGWGGTEREEDPGDVDLTPGADEPLPPAANQQNQEEESESNDRVSNKQPIPAEKKQNPSRIEI